MITLSNFYRTRGAKDKKPREKRRVLPYAAGAIGTGVVVGTSELADRKIMKAYTDISPKVLGQLLGANLRRKERLARLGKTEKTISQLPVEKYQHKVNKKLKKVINKVESAGKLNKAIRVVGGLTAAGLTLKALHNTYKNKKDKYKILKS